MTCPLPDLVHRSNSASITAYAPCDSGDPVGEAEGRQRGRPVGCSRLVGKAAHCLGEGAEGCATRVRAFLAEHR